MANTIIAGNGTNNGLAVTSDATGALNILTGSGAGTAAISIDSSQNVTMAAAQTVTGNQTVGGNLTVTGTLSASGGVTGSLKSATVQTSTSGTSIDFTSIPSGVKRITVMCKGLSTNGTSIPQIQIGTSGGIQTSGYVGATWIGNTTNAAHSSGYLICGNFAANYIVESVCVLTLIDSATGSWMCSINGGVSVAAVVAIVGAGSKSLSGTLDRVRITTVNGTDTFDAGSINIIYE